MKDAMSFKISFIHYMKWTRGMLPVVLEKFKVFCIIFATIFFTIMGNW